MTPTPDTMSPVSRTALSVARVRAYESGRPDPLFVDPYAAEFVAAAGPPTEAPEGTRLSGLAAMLVMSIMLRTRFYDDRLTAAGAEQVVLLAAGLDTRAYRLDWPVGTRVWELDLPPVLAFKEQVLDSAGAAPKCEREALAGDLLDPGWPRRLVEAGFDPQRPTAWLAEGLVVYFDAEQAAGLLTAIGSLSAPGSRLLMERGRDVSRTPHDPTLAHVTELWQGGLGPDTDKWLDAHGWSTRTTSLAEAGDTYGRPLSDGLGRTSGFIEAVRTAAG
ncbi:class I SAM-dependent methyltransferase [Kitasatospora cathayae]|uniref:S-adenosyl-L-methionine-dependent methyltransferase n=1 Tax=Kitasatospora cathayae TaxID=3004092 RepID=A0ABY7PW46_9ACTN|nr:class I SAM-dependent methyltransferase [Kitasatospora sp. HUAS 3-15]WBP84412.1 class I SAM-dependent methyltransferase [Kitasatospora sp. HUAS 3-15]